MSTNTITGISFDATFKKEDTLTSFPQIPEGMEGIEPLKCSRQFTYSGATYVIHLRNDGKLQSLAPKAWDTLESQVLNLVKDTFPPHFKTAKMPIREGKFHIIDSSNQELKLKAPLSSEATEALNKSVVYALSSAKPFETLPKLPPPQPTLALLSSSPVPEKNKMSSKDKKLYLEKLHERHTNTKPQKSPYVLVPPQSLFVENEKLSSYPFYEKMSAYLNANTLQNKENLLFFFYLENIEKGRDASLIVDYKAKKIFYYDPEGKRPSQELGKAIDDLKNKLDGLLGEKEERWSSVIHSKPHLSSENETQSSVLNLSLLDSLLNGVSFDQFQPQSEDFSLLTNTIQVLLTS